MSETPSHQELEVLRQELDERASEIALLLETSRLIGSEQNLDAVFAAIAERARVLIKSETVLVPILSPDRKSYTYRAGVGANVDEIVGETLPVEFGLCGWVLRNQRPWWNGAVAELNEEERNLWEHEAGTILLVPLVGRDAFLGGLAGINKQGGGNFTRRDLDLLQLFAAQAAIAIEHAMAMEKVAEARQEAEHQQLEMKRLNRRLDAANSQLEKMSLFDPLTGLPNRTLFRDRTNHEISIAQSTGDSLSILFIDLDKFQDINNSYGQETGDLLLMNIATALGGMLGPEDTLSRLSGDEFAALICHADATIARGMARAMNERLGGGITINDHHIATSASIGIASFPAHGDTLSQLMKNADLAVRNAKRDKAGCYIYDATRDSASDGRYALVQRLSEALDRQEFVLYYQPKLDLAEGCITGFEALSRWPQPKSSMVPPDIFITALEQTQMILPFTRWVIGEAIVQLQAWRNKGWEVSIAVNVPPMVLMNPDFMKFLEAQKSLDGLTFEITENVFLGDIGRLARIMQHISERGIDLSIDDFGTGYSSLQRLRQTPVDEIKIDGSFIRGMQSNSDDAVIVHSTIELARNLGLRVVGEGVEDATTLSRLTKLGCHSVQGFHVCRPLPPAALEDFLARATWKPRLRQRKQDRA